MISVVIPTLNEAAGIAQMLAPLQSLRQQGGELILVDGGSVDGTVELARPHVDSLLTSEPGRARQMAAGAEVAQGELLWFLHADTTVSVGTERLLLAAMRQGPWGRFDVRLSGEQPLLRVVEWMMNRRSCWSGVATGDQGIFLRRSLYQQVGGIPQVPLMEDIAFSKRLRAVAPPVCVDTTLTTSSRRWEQKGVVRTIVLMWWLRFAYWAGVSPQRLAGWYR